MACTIVWVTSCVHEACVLNYWPLSRPCSEELKCVGHIVPQLSASTSIPSGRADLPLPYSLLHFWMSPLWCCWTCWGSSTSPWPWLLLWSYPIVSLNRTRCSLIPSHWPLLVLHPVPIHLSFVFTTVKHLQSSKQLLLWCFDINILCKLFAALGKRTIRQKYFIMLSSSEVIFDWRDWTAEYSKS